MMILKKFAVVGALLGTSLAYAFAPQTGTWIMTSEVNGKPGRGLAIDVQDNTLVMQMYAYDASGNATFYMTSGTLANDRYSAPLNKYRGGRYLGSGDLSGKEDGSAGTVSIRFESGTKGYITLPGEAEKEISIQLCLWQQSRGPQGNLDFQPPEFIDTHFGLFQARKDASGNGQRQWADHHCRRHLWL